MTARKPRTKYDYNRLKQYCEENNIELTKNYSEEKINRDTIIEANCLNCSGDVKKHYREFVKTGCFCDMHMKQNSEEKKKTTNLERRGVEHPGQDPKVKEKAKATNLERRGVEYVLQDPKVKEKTKATNLERRGVEYPGQDPKVKEKAKATNLERRGVEYVLQDPKVKEKTKATNLERRGVENAFQCKEVQEKARLTNLERRGVEYTFQSKEVQEKTKATNLERRGVEYTFQDPKVREKANITKQERYGCKSAMQNAELFEKQQKSCFKTKEYIFPSGRIDYVQGYEPQALDILIQSYKEDDIVTSNHEIESLCGEIKYTFEGKECKYYTDIYIKSLHTFIEVKSDYTFETKKEKNFKKREACINAGINFEFWIMDKKGNLLEII